MSRSNNASPNESGNYFGAMPKCSVSQLMSWFSELTPSQQAGKWEVSLVFISETQHLGAHLWMRKNIYSLSEKEVAGIKQNLKYADQILEIFDAEVDGAE